MNMKYTNRRLLFVGNLSAPYKVKFSHALDKIRGWDVKFCFCTDEKPDRPKYWKISLPPSSVVLKPLWFSSTEKCYFNPTIINFCNDFNPDVIILGSYSIPTMITALIWAKLKKKKVFFGELEVPAPSKRLKRLTRNLLCKSICSFSDGILACGREAVNYYKKLLPSKRVYNFPYAADLKLFFKHPLRQRNLDKVIFLYSGRLIKIHNATLLVKCFCKLYKKYKNVRLIICAEGELRPECEKMIKDYHIEEGIIRWMTNIAKWEDINEIYRISHVLVFPTKFCGWGLVVAEAMASGMAVISSKYSVAGVELIEHGVTGYLTELDENELIHYMEKYAVNPELVRIHGIRGREKAKKYSLEYKARELISILEKELN